MDRVIKLPPTTDIFETPVGKVKRPEKKLERKPDEEKKTDEKPEVPTTKPIEDEQRPKLKAQAIVPPEATKEPEVTDKKGDVDSDQKDESGSDQKSESDQKNESDSAAPPVKPDSESEDKEKRD